MFQESSTPSIKAYFLEVSSFHLHIKLNGYIFKSTEQIRKVLNNFENLGGDGDPEHFEYLCSTSLKNLAF